MSKLALPYYLKSALFWSIKSILTKFHSKFLAKILNLQSDWQISNFFDMRNVPVIWHEKYTYCLSKCWPEIIFYGKFGFLGSYNFNLILNIFILHSSRVRKCVKSVISSYPLDTNQLKGGDWGVWAVFQRCSQIKIWDPTAEFLRSKVVWGHILNIGNIQSRCRFRILAKRH